MKRFNENETDYQNWLSKYKVTDDVLDEIDKTYSELYDDLFNNPDNLSNNKDKWIIFKVESSSFKDLFDDLKQINFIGKDFTFSKFKLEKDDPNNPVYSADKTATADIIGRDGKTIIQDKNSIRRAKNLSLSTLRSQLNSNMIKWEKEPELYDYYIKITKDLKEITHMSTDKDWTSCMRITKASQGIYSNVIIGSIKNGLLVAYVYKVKAGDFKSINGTDKQFAEDAIARISINPYESKSKFLYLKAMKTYATQKFHNEKPFNLQETVQNYLDKHYNFGLLDSEDIFYSSNYHYNDLNLKSIRNNNIFDAVANNNIKVLEKYIDDGKNLNIKDERGYGLLDYALSNDNERVITLLRSYNLKITLTDDNIKNRIRNYISFNGAKCDLNVFDVSQVTTMDLLFYNTKFNGNVSKWDTSNVRSMDSLFSYCPFNGDISKWNVSKVTNMEAIFKNSKFNKDISKWDTSNVTNMTFMFINSKFNKDISNWNTSKVNNMNWMFGNSKFNQNINKWDVSKVVEMAHMFRESQFNQDISNWNVSNVTNMDKMFNESQFNQDINNWNVSKVTNMSSMFENSPLQDNPPVWFKKSDIYIA